MLAGLLLNLDGGVAPDVAARGGDDAPRNRKQRRKWLEDMKARHASLEAQYAHRRQYEQQWTAELQNAYRALTEAPATQARAVELVKPFEAANEPDWAAVARDLERSTELLAMYYESDDEEAILLLI